MIDQKVIIEETEDGSHTLFVPLLNEHYHSVHGAVQESNHVFISAGLSQLQQKEISVFEVGFGTGLNAFLTAKYALKNQLNINYIAIEANPIPINLVEQLNYANEEDKELYQKLHNIEWESSLLITDCFALKKIEADFTVYNFAQSKDTFDLIYFDAFAPDIQGDMWSQALFNSMYEILKVGGVLTTYCAKGEIRRRMQTAGFAVERIPGPPGKREMLRARK